MTTAVCPTEYAINVIGGKWKVLIIFKLSKGTKRFSELQRLLPQITKKMLTQQLRELEDDGIIMRKVYAQVPPKVEYSLTLQGEKINPILDMLTLWGKDLLLEQHQNQTSTL